MNRRAFLQSLMAGAVAAVVPLPTTPNSYYFAHYCEDALDFWYGSGSGSSTVIISSHVSPNKVIGTLGNNPSRLRIRNSTGSDGPGVNWVKSRYFDPEE